MRLNELTTVVSPGNIMKMLEIIEDDNIVYYGNCTQDDIVDDIFGSVSEFARMIDTYGDNFKIGDLIVKYDDITDIHHFYYKEKTAAAKVDGGA